MTRTEHLITFLKEIERFKQVKRVIPLSGSDEYEDDAQHVWHTLMFLFVLDRDLPTEIDRLKVVKLLLVHDLPELHAGDTFAFDAAAQHGKHDREKSALTQLLATLPVEIAEEMAALWYEFEANESVEAKLAHALDKLQPILQNLVSDGRAWRHHGLTYQQVDAHKRPSMEGFDAVLTLYDALMAESKAMFAQNESESVIAKRR